jgi:hypothetical protein
MKDLIAKMELFPFATASRAGAPNVVPVKFLQVADDETLWIMDNYFDKTLTNLTENPLAAVYIWSPATPACFQIKGGIEIRDAGSEYEQMRAVVLAKKPDAPARALVVMRIVSIFNCLPGPDAGTQVA